MKQVIPRSHWPSGISWTVGILDRTAEELAQAHGLTFEFGSDDLGAYSLAAILTNGVGEVWLFQRTDGPCTGTEFQVDAAVPRSRALRALKRELGCTSADLIWVTSDEVAPELALAGKS